MKLTDAQKQWVGGLISIAMIGLGTYALALSGDTPKWITAVQTGLGSAAAMFGVGVMGLGSKGKSDAV